MRWGWSIKEKASIFFLFFTSLNHPIVHKLCCRCATASLFLWASSLTKQQGFPRYLLFHTVIFNKRTRRSVSKYGIVDPQAKDLSRTLQIVPDTETEQSPSALTESLRSAATRTASRHASPPQDTAGALPPALPPRKHAVPRACAAPPEMTPSKPATVPIP